MPMAALCCAVNYLPRSDKVPIVLEQRFEFDRSAALCAVSERP
jgi:hypothetical protein